MLKKNILNNNLLLFAGIIFFVVLVLYFEVRVLNLEGNNEKLVSEVAIVRKQLLASTEKEANLHMPIIGGGAGGGSLVEVPNVNLKDRRDLVVIYNRVPKTGSTSFINVAYDLCRLNSYHARFAFNVSKWDSIKPALYHGHVAYVHFEKFGVNLRPVWINLIRRPLDRLVSYYYFLRYGDDFRPHLVRRKHGDKVTFDECVEKKQPDCHPDNMWLQVPFFCGHSALCWEPGNKWALEEAKRNLISHYLLVGVTEEMEDFIHLLEITLPSFFEGATKHYLNSKKSHLRRTVQKADPSASTIKKIQESKVWQMEQELYDFALAQFHFMRKRTLGLSASNRTSQFTTERSQQFMYEKIRPK
ncbi:Heparin sulfate O-sulfotransferase [Frankliniella fusca]|uniref:Heparin sulfate O-sulfotransferase n=1 Tax=Frankliniella fusca TaxID=407009 RepID=A0AAE1LYY9_9NEOP|nr:Heparin sulfate O-sulfotransferase [Frankliniella fusca]